MAEDSSDKTLVKIAIFCITMSIMTTCLAAMYFGNSGDYDYDMINTYRADLVDFSGGQLVNDNPWVLVGVYTPFVPGSVADEDIPDHIERDGNQSSGWLFGEKITTYPYLDKSSDIKLDKNQKSNQLLTFGTQFDYEYRNGMSEWAEYIDPEYIKNADRFFAWMTGTDPLLSDNYGYETISGSANNWNYTGYRYVFDPVLPFSSEASSKDGRLSIVWYEIPGDTGLSGALEIYAGKNNEQIKLGQISASDIINTFRSSEGYVNVFDFDFEGTHLNLTIRFDPTVYGTYNTLQAAWDDGAWSMAISSASAGNFFDVENSNAFSVTAGSALDTFVQIYTFDYPHFKDTWAEVIMWLLVGLPMTMGMLFVTKALIGGIFRIF